MLYNQAVPRRGGEADKLGNQYEGFWAVDAVLDLLDGTYSDLVFEPIGEEADGIEFFAMTMSGRREYHSIKRQHRMGNWTISRLTATGANGRSILGDLSANVFEDAEAVFSSGTSATQLDELTERARGCNSFEDFQRSIQQSKNLVDEFHNRIVPLRANAESAYTVLQRLRVRTKNESQLRKDVELRIRLSLRPSGPDPIDGPAVRRLIAELVNDRLGQTLTSSVVLESLEPKGLRPLHLNGDDAVAQRLARLNQTYLADAERLLINDTRISRPEVGIAVDSLVEQGRSVMLEGGAGSGKSCVIAQIMRSLEDRDVPCLAIRLDRLTEGDRPTARLGTNRGLPASPVISLGNSADNQPSVLCIDQLDAVSVVSARQQWAWDTLNELLEEARAYPNMRVLFGCRSFDMEQDPRLRQLSRDADQAERLRVGNLDHETIRLAIDAAGLHSQTLTPQQLDVLSTPLHLYLFLEGSRSASLDFTRAGDLYDRFWRDKSRAVNEARPGAWSLAIKALCDALSARETLSVQRHILDDHVEALDLMASHSVVVISDDVRFFHESFFDYAFARVFETSHADLVSWLKSDQQHLFRRSQVRQVVAFLRRNGADHPEYLRTLSGLLGDPAIRFHIRQLILDWTGSLSDPTEPEWSIIQDHSSELGNEPWGFVRDSLPWFDLLNSLRRWKEWLQDDVEWRERALWLLRQDKVLNARAAAIVPMVKAASDGSEEWQAQLWILASGGRGYDSKEMRDFLLELVAEGVPELPALVQMPFSDVWQVLNNIDREDSTYKIRVISAWFDRQLLRAQRAGQVKEFGHPRPGCDSNHWSKEVIGHCAEGDARQFAAKFWPRFIMLELAAPSQVLWGYRDAGNPLDQLRESLAEAMRQLAVDNPDELDRLLQSEDVPETIWVDHVLLRAWGGNPGRYGDMMVNFLLQRPEERLKIGYAGWPAGADGYLAVSRAAIAAASSDCSDEAFDRLEAAIVFLKMPRETAIRGNFRPTGGTEYVLLCCLPFNRMSDMARRRIQELERKFPNAPKRAAPEEDIEPEIASWVQSPLPPEAVLRMTDDQWISAIEKYRQDNFDGGALEVSRDLERATRDNPQRFVELAKRLDQTHNPSYFGAILSGLTVDADGRHHDAVPEHVFTVVRRIVKLGMPLNREIASALGNACHTGLPNDMATILIRIVETAEDPKADTWGDGPNSMGRDPLDQAINSDRGAAATTLARALFADNDLWPRVNQSVAALAADPVLAVRAATVDCLLAVLDSHRSDAFVLFEALVRGADRLLGTSAVERFLFRAIYRDYGAVRQIVMHMLKAGSPSAVASAAKLIAFAGLSEASELAQSDAKGMSELNEGARRGVAEVYARYVADRTVGTQCQEHLTALFEDDDAEVREQAARCWVYVESDDVPELGSLMKKYVRSRAFADAVRGSNVLAHRLEECGRPLPEEFCDLLEQSLELRQAKGSPDAFYLHDLPKLAIRMHEETRDLAVRVRVLDAIDKMMRLGVHGVTERVKERFER